MVTIQKIVGASSCAFVLCFGLSFAYAAHPQAETNPSDDRGSQGNQALIKGDSTPLKGEEEKVDEGKLLEQRKNATPEVDRNNAKPLQKMREKSTVPKTKSTLRKLTDATAE